MLDPTGRRKHGVHAFALRDAAHRRANADATSPAGPTPVAPSDVPRVPRPPLTLVKDDPATGD